MKRYFEFFGMAFLLQATLNSGVFFTELSWAQSGIIQSFDIPENSVEVFDDSSSTVPLTGTTDFDDLNDRVLSIRWNYVGSYPIEDWHIYVRKGDGGYQYLNHTGNGAAREYLWLNPDINAQYQFRVWGIYKNAANKNLTVVLSQPGPLGYNLTGGSAIGLKRIANPDDLPAGVAVVTDDLYHTKDLSNAVDIDTPLERALALKFNPGAGDFENFHIYYKKTTGDQFGFLGQTGAGDIYCFRFDGNRTFSQATAELDGPQSGTTYWFLIYALKTDGSIITMTTGPVTFYLNSLPPATPTPTNPSNPTRVPTITPTPSFTATPISNPTPLPSATPNSGNPLTTVLRDLPDQYFPGTPFMVTLPVTLSAETAANSGIAIEEIPPTGWTVFEISDGGSWDEQNLKIKWLFFPGATPPDHLTYKITPPAGSTGIADFDGDFTYTINYKPISGKITGDLQIQNG